MGTTIHAHIEVKRDAKWFHYSAPAIQRNYLLFASISGERYSSIPSGLQGLIKPHASVKGLPDDLSEVTAFCYKQDKSGYKLHGECVLTSEDLKSLQKWLSDFSSYTGDKYDLEEDVFHCYINSNCIASHQGWDDVRVVLWYDN